MLTEKETIETSATWSYLSVAFLDLEIDYTHNILLLIELAETYADDEGILLHVHKYGKLTTERWNHSVWI
jgi:hypothetical protein